MKYNSAYRRGGFILTSNSYEEIVYTDIDSPMGEMIAGATERGVCFLEWHDRGGVARILERVRKRYGVAPVLDQANNAHLQKLRVELEAYFLGSLSAFTVPIDVAGTPFQKLVWSELLEIPAGETKSYLQLANAVGKPGAPRQWLELSFACDPLPQSD